MHRRNPTLQASNVEMGAGEVDLIPFQINRLSNPQPMPRHDEDQGRVTMAVAAFTGGAD
jgi:hypothetical protein